MSDARTLLRNGLIVPVVSRPFYGDLHAMAGSSCLVSSTPICTPSCTC